MSNDVKEFFEKNKAHICAEVALMDVFRSVRLIDLLERILHSEADEKTKRFMLLMVSGFMFMSDPDAPKIAPIMYAKIMSSTEHAETYNKIKEMYASVDVQGVLTLLKAEKEAQEAEKNGIQ